MKNSFDRYFSGMLFRHARFPILRANSTQYDKPTILRSVVDPLFRCKFDWIFVEDFAFLPKCSTLLITNNSTNIYSTTLRKVLNTSFWVEKSRYIISLKLVWKVSTVAKRLYETSQEWDNALFLFIPRFCRQNERAIRLPTFKNLVFFLRILVD